VFTPYLTEFQVASMPLRKSQQSKNSVAVEEREEGELSAEDEESLVPAMVSSSPPPLLRVFFLFPPVSFTPSIYYISAEIPISFLFFVCIFFPLEP
jgi:hypothetical protein